MSSLLRVMQAALRQSARLTPIGLDAFASKPEPMLMVTADTDIEQQQLALTFFFANATTHKSLNALSESSFKVFFYAIESLLKSQPRLTLWGGPARLGSTGDRDPDRTDLAWQELSRMPNVSIELGKRRIKVLESSVEIS